MSSVKAPILRAEKLTKNFGPLCAVDQVGFELFPGEIFGLVGPDGAGKTTLLRLLCNLLPADAGKLEILGVDALRQGDSLRDDIAYMPQRFSLYEDLTLAENLDFFATIFGLAGKDKTEKIDFFLNLTNLAPHKEKLAGQLSGGMKQKLALAANLIHRPRILFLDEPSTGVDPVARREFWDVLRGMRQDGVSIVVATPYMEEAGYCDRMLLLAAGKVVACGDNLQVTACFPHSLVMLECLDPFQAKRQLGKVSELLIDYGIYGNSLRMTTQAPEELIQQLSLIFPQEKRPYRSPATIEDAFVYLTKKRGE